MKRNILIAVLVVGIAVVTVYSFNQQRELAKLKEQLAQIEKQKKTELKTEAPKPVVTTEKNEQSKSSEVAVKSTGENAEVKPRSDRRDRSRFGGKQQMEEWAKMMKSPEMKEMMKARSMEHLDMMYGKLFKGLNMPEDKLKQFKELLVDRQMSMMEMSMDVFMGDKSKEEKEAGALKITEAGKEYDKKMQDLLGDNYEVYKQYEETQPERMSIDRFKRSLDNDSQLSDQQENDLIIAMHEERTNFTSLASINNPANMNLANITPETFEKMGEELDQLNNKCLERASTILTTNQYQVYKTVQKQNQAMNRMGLRWASNMMQENSRSSEQAAPQEKTVKPPIK